MTIDDNNSRDVSSVSIIIDLKENSKKREYPFFRTGESIMASTLVPEAKKALEQFKMEAANEVGVTLNQGYNGDLTSRQAGSIGGQMVKKMVEKYEKDIKTK